MMTASKLASAIRQTGSCSLCDLRRIRSDASVACSNDTSDPIKAYSNRQ